MKLAWLTDLHLEFLSEGELETFLAELAAVPADAFMLGGDIGTATSVVRFLRALDERLGRPVHFVLGNHDFYGGSIAEVRAGVRALCAPGGRLHWLEGDPTPVRLTAATALVGHGGWGDARLGDFAGSRVRLNDFVQIRDLTGHLRPALAQRLGELGDEAAAHLRAVLPAAAAVARHVVVLTHVPPFEEACWHEGRISAPDWLPFFTCKAAGDALLEAAHAFPDRRITVLCGHTHGGGEAQVLPNLTVSTGPARYGEPVLQRVLEVE